MTLRFTRPALGLRGIPVSDGVPQGRADLVVFGAPHGTPYPDIDNGPFSAAPAALRAGVSHFAHWMDHWDFDVGGPILGEGPFHPFDAGDLPTKPLDGAGNRALIREATEAVLAKGAVPIMFGGDDSTPIPFIEGFAKHGPICIVQIDAHIDWREEREGERFGFSSTMRRASEMAHVTHMVQVGMRGFGSARAREVEDATRWGAKLVTAREVHNRGIDAALEHVPDGARCVITVDCDGLDPSIMPAVMALAPGGLTYTQAIDLIAGVARKGRIVGFDVVEFVPARDPAGLAAMTAARLAVNALGHVARQKR
ncbi:MAG: agmatinase [Alphaproteobacteria bacterium]